jgi:hypothetical protein
MRSAPGASTRRSASTASSSTDNPADWNTIKKIGRPLRPPQQEQGGERRVREGRRSSSTRDGFLLKAIAVWKQINKLDPSTLEPYQNLADLYAKQGLMVEAKASTRSWSTSTSSAAVREAGDALKKMADIDPSDLKVRSKLADLYTTRRHSRAKASRSTWPSPTSSSARATSRKRCMVLEKGLKIDGKSVKLRSELARIHLAQKNYDRPSTTSRKPPQDRTTPRPTCAWARVPTSEPRGWATPRPSSAASSRATPTTPRSDTRWAGCS